MFDGQCNAQPPYGFLSVLFLASTFRRTGRYGRWGVSDVDRRFNFVAVLPAWSAAPPAGHFAVQQQDLLSNARWMVVNRSVSRFVHEAIFNMS